MTTFENVTLTDHCRIVGAFRGLAVGRPFAEGFRAHRVHGFMPDFSLLP